MTATTVTPELRKHFVFLFDLGIEYFNTCIAGDPREAARSLEYDASVYHALHAKLAEVVHSDVELTTEAFAFEGRELLGGTHRNGRSRFRLHARSRTRQDPRTLRQGLRRRPRRQLRTR